MNEPSLLEILARYAPIWMTVGFALLSGIVLNYLGIRYFNAMSNGAVFAIGALLAVLVAIRFLDPTTRTPGWQFTLLLPLIVWAFGLVSAWLDKKLHLSVILAFLSGAVIGAALAVVLANALFGDAIKRGPLGEPVYTIGLMLVFGILGGVISLKVNRSKVVLILACALFGSVLIGIGWTYVPLLAGQTTETGTAVPAITEQVACLAALDACDATLAREGKSLQDRLPWARAEWLIVPLSGIIVQLAILAHYKRKGQSGRLSSAL